MRKKCSKGCLLSKARAFAKSDLAENTLARQANLNYERPPSDIASTILNNLASITIHPWFEVHIEISSHTWSRVLGGQEPTSGVVLRVFAVCLWSCQDLVLRRLAVTHDSRPSS